MGYYAAWRSLKPTLRDYLSVTYSRIKMPSVYSAACFGPHGSSSGEKNYVRWRIEVSVYNRLNTNFVLCIKIVLKFPVVVNVGKCETFRLVLSEFCPRDYRGCTVFYFLRWSCCYHISLRSGISCSGHSSAIWVADVRHSHFTKRLSVGNSVILRQCKLPTSYFLFPVIIRRGFTSRGQIFSYFINALLLSSYFRTIYQLLRLLHI
jgi:hypothetical protein